MIPSSRAQEIVHAFQRQYKTDGPKAIKGFTLLELIETETHLGKRDFNSGHRLLIRQRIAELGKKADRKHDRHIRAWNIINTLLIALLAYALRDQLF